MQEHCTAQSSFLVLESERGQAVGVEMSYPSPHRNTAQSAACNITHNIWAKFNCLSQWEWKWGLFHNVWNRYLKGHTAYVWLYKTISMHDSFTLELAEFSASVIFVVNLITVWNVYYNKAENYWLNMQKCCNWIQNCTHKTQRETSNAREATQKKMFLITALICTDKARTKIHKNTLLCQLSCLHCKYYRNMQGS